MTDVRAPVIQAVDGQRERLVELLRGLVACRSENPKLLDDPARQEEGRAGEAACQTAIAGHLTSSAWRSTASRR